MIHVTNKSNIFWFLQSFELINDSKLYNNELMQVFIYMYFQVLNLDQHEKYYIIGTFNFQIDSKTVCRMIKLIYKQLVD